MFSKRYIWIDAKSNLGKEIISKSNDLIFNSEGNFKYNNEGFEYENLGQHIQIEWKNVKSISGYNRDAVTIDTIGLIIQTKQNEIFEFNEELFGWYQFIEKLKIEFSLSADFEAKLMFPPFSNEIYILYDFEK